MTTQYFRFDGHQTNQLYMKYEIDTSTFNELNEGLKY